MMTKIFSLIWPKIIDIQTAERASRQGLYRSILGICEFIIIMHFTESPSIDFLPINLSTIWVTVGALIYYKLRLGAFVLFGLESVISYLKYTYISTASSPISVMIILSSIIYIVLSLNSIRGIIKYNKYKTVQEQMQRKPGFHLNKADLLARIIEFAFFLAFGILANILSKP
jgi:hypothetical protein